MTDSNPSLVPSPPVASRKTSGVKKFFTFLIFLIVVIILSFTLALYSGFITLQAGDSENAQRIDDMDSRIQQLEKETAALKQAILTEPTAEEKTGKTETRASSMPSSLDTAKMQSDITALSAALVSLQKQVDQNKDKTAHSQQDAQNRMAASLAFIQLREAALSGQSFTAELDALHQASLDSEALQPAVMQLQPYAADGIATLALLEENLVRQEKPAAKAIAKAEAQNVLQRLLAELRGLISIRRLHGDKDDIFAAMENDVAKNNLTAALDDMNELPIAAQKQLIEWRQKTEARKTVQEALQTLAQSLTKPVPTAAMPTGDK